jgi:RHH-type proline utilization regulon transcriptional repressor/proline dehydrogenase/delta 1-pyrroline-5-carboxylate dehydrogenase
MALIFASDSTGFDPTQNAIRAAFLADETRSVEALLNEAALDAALTERVQTLALDLVREVRESPTRGGLDAFLQVYDLGTREGVVLMCLAEALLRIPDTATADRLIQSLVLQGNWEKHLGKSESLLVNASTWGLLLTGRIMRALSGEEARTLVKKLASRLGDAALRTAMRSAMQILGAEFVIGETIADALANTDSRFRYSFDMLGEAALTQRDSERYFESYSSAIDAVGKAGARESFSAPGVSIKLSALHPRYEFSQRDRVLRELTPRLLTLVRQARDSGVMITLDAEEADRLELSLDLFKLVYSNAEIREYEGLGLAVQAYQKRAPHVIDWLAQLARENRKTIALRLVKGAYWDAEIKRAQVHGLDGYPVFTSKAHTDVSYLACGRRVLAHGDAFYPQFATHNAHTVAYFLELAKNREFEFQRLYGMGEALYSKIIDRKPCRVYAPVGSFDTLLPYLVRRLLENGANTSFVNRIGDAELPAQKIVESPVAQTRARGGKPHPRIPLPRDLYSERRNSQGTNLADPAALSALASAMRSAAQKKWRASPLVNGKALSGDERTARNPADATQAIGTVVDADERHLENALELAHKAAASWDEAPASQRAQMLERAADLFEQHRAELATLIVREGGRIIPDALAEVREAVDYCRYYAQEARRLFGTATALPGPSGEANTLMLRGRGVFACISPWNFPLAIFTGQVAAALAAGNAVIAKPAEQTPLVAMRAIELLHEAGVPGEALNFLPGSGEKIGARLVADRRIAGIVFTGSTETAKAIGHALAAREGPIIPFIAETGGMNAIVADSSALPEQLIGDVIQSAFNSAGQRCSAARLLFVQDDVAEPVMTMLEGAMKELRIGNPSLLATDVGPMIDEEAKRGVERYCEELAQNARQVAIAPPPQNSHDGFYLAPRAFEISFAQIPPREVFGPVLHVIRWNADELDRVIAAINDTGYGLTLGIHSRIDTTIDKIRSEVRAGNIYVNRNIIGAVVGVQPFGGEGLSGTGPKAGGPNYLARFAVERTVSVNTAAIGGNASLLALDD